MKELRTERTPILFGQNRSGKVVYYNEVLKPRMLASGIQHLPLFLFTSFIFYYIIT